MEKEILAPGIICYKNVFPNSDKILNQIGDNWGVGGVDKSRISDDAYSLVDKSIRDVSVHSVHNEEIKKHFSVCEDDYINTYGVNIVDKKYIPYQILKYEIGQHFDTHTDDVPGSKRILSQTYYFNDNYEGGEIYFDKFDLLYKPAAKDLLIFPSMWVYSHAAKPVVSGIKYAIVCFISD